MSKFTIGDRVRVTTHRAQHGQEGVVEEVARIPLPILGRIPLPILVRFTTSPYSTNTNTYEESDLTLLEECQIMPEPEFDLEEIERAERLVHDD